MQFIVTLLDYENRGKLAFLQSLVHEMLHVNSFLSFQKLSAQESERGYELTTETESGEKGTISLGLRRQGFRIQLSRKKALGREFYFHNLDESVIAELTMRFDWEFFPEIPQLEEECRRREEIVNAESRRSGRSAEGLKRKVANVETKRLESDYMVTLQGYSRDKEREEFNTLVDDLYERNKSEFSSREEIFGLFAKAIMNGRLLPVARLVEKTFGKGSFREIGERTKQKE